MDTRLLRLEKVGPGDARIDTIHGIRAECAQDLLSRFGQGHWATCSTLAQINREASARALYVVYLDTRIVGTFALTREPPGFFELERFHYPRDPAAYLSALAVTPELQGQGIGTWCMQQSDDITVSWSCRALRFDAYDSPAGAAPFYERYGYVPRGKIIFNRVPLILFEKVLQSAR